MINVRDYGATGDGVTPDTDAIQKALDTGAVVSFPPGTYYTGTIYLRSGGGLHLESGAMLLASVNPADYNRDDFAPHNRASVQEKASGAHLIIAENCDGLTLSGSGTINGNGRSFVDLTEYECDNPARPIYRRLDWRPGQMLYFYGCRNVSLRDLTLENASYWNCFLLDCEDVTVEKLKIASDRKITNTDGIDIDCSRRVKVTGCDIDCGDDSIAIRAAEKRAGHSAPCEDIQVENCRLSTTACGVRLGVGNGIIRRVHLRGLEIYNAPIGIAFCPRYNTTCVQMEDIRIENCQIKAKQALVLTPCWFAREYDDGDKPIRQVRFENIVAETQQPCTFTAPEKDPSLYSGFQFRNCHFTLRPPLLPPKPHRWPLPDYGVLCFLRMKPELTGIEIKNPGHRKDILMCP